METIPKPILIGSHIVTTAMRGLSLAELINSLLLSRESATDHCCMLQVALALHYYTPTTCSGVAAKPRAKLTKDRVG